MPDQPNILFIFSDQQRWDTLGCYGSPIDLTPNLDAMAAGGVRFDKAFTCQPVCGPARSCLQTGLYATETGCWRNDIALPQNIPTVPRRLRAAGYEVGYIGKWHLASTGEDNNYRTKPVPPELRGGYDDYWLASDVLEFTSHAYDGHMFNADMDRVEFPEGKYRVDALTGFALDYLRTRDREQPFFLFLSFIEPHHQNDHNHFEGPTGSKDRFKNAPVPADLEGTDGDWREEWADYLGCCGRLDEAVGCLRAELDALGLADDTLVIYTSDHGCHFRTRNSEYKRSCHENTIRVPMVVNGPGFRGGQVADNLVSLIDLPPTIMSAAGENADDMQGRSLQPLADGTAEEWLDEVFVQISESQTGRAIRTPRWKYSVRAPGKSAARADAYHEDFLYDLNADPHEKTNLVRAPAHEGTRAVLRDRLIRRMKEANEKTPRILPPQESLG
ncbi:MAG: sulfatase-like hydrolase/transferase [bacterium]|nr:sulfatase-like hydrolase/transferase [bacterium]